MVDYSKLATEAKTRHVSAKLETAEEKKRNRELLVFFKSVEINIAKEINMANPNLARAGVPTFGGPGTAQNDWTINLSFGKRTRCRVAIDQHVIEGSTAVGVEMGGDIPKQTLGYLIEHDGTGLKAYKILEGGAVDRDKQFTPGEIAEAVVSGIIKGRLE
jgi:hypothetical protein